MFDGFRNLLAPGALRVIHPDNLSEAFRLIMNLLLRAVVERMIFAYKVLVCTNRCYVLQCQVRTEARACLRSVLHAAACVGLT
jgi:hypothetical protein